MKLLVLSLLYILTETRGVSTGIKCYNYTPFVVKTSPQEGRMSISRTFATITTKICQGYQQCSRLQITDTANQTYIGLDCLDRSTCEHPASWCHKFTDSLLTSCEITCCDGSLCAERNRTKAVVTKNPNIQKAQCSVFTPFQVDTESREVTQVYSQVETKLCEFDERCGGVVLTDRKNKTHQASACVSHNHCENPDMFCRSLTEGTNGTFLDCELKCCNGSYCLEKQKSNQKTCYEYSSFALTGNGVKLSNDTGGRVKTCNKDELCSRGTFTDKSNNTHVSLNCVATSICNNPSIFCQYFSKSNPQSPFSQCNVECCQGNMCFPDSIPKSLSPPSTSNRKQPTLTTTSSTTQVQAQIGITLKATILFFMCLNIFLD